MPLEPNTPFVFDPFRITACLESLPLVRLWPAGCSSWWRRACRWFDWGSVTLSGAKGWVNRGRRGPCVSVRISPQDLLSCSRAAMAKPSRLALLLKASPVACEGFCLRGALVCRGLLQCTTPSPSRHAALHICRNQAMGFRSAGEDLDSNLRKRRRFPIRGRELPAQEHVGHGRCGFLH